MEEKIEAMSLYEFNKTIRTTIDKAELRQWVVGEISEIHCASVGHYYIELIEKSVNNGTIVARLRCNIWANIARYIVSQFEEITEQPLQAGQKVMVLVAAQFHESYGLSGNITAINPSFTLGEMERLKREIINRLTAEGVIDMNKTLALPTVLQRIAVITARTAAGFGDFKKQLDDNEYGFGFKVTLFSATMQGIDAENSIINALDAIANQITDYDVVAIIRGGGSRSDLVCYDSYDLANNIAQFPLPIITGIGHERDNSIADMVAHTRLKTPTAVAEFIITHNAEFLAQIENLKEQIECTIFEKINSRNDALRQMQMSFQMLIRNNLTAQTIKCDNLYRRLIVDSTSRQNVNRMKLSSMKQMLVVRTSQIIQQNLYRIESLTKLLQANNPKEILRKGYTLTMYNGKRITQKSNVIVGDKITTITSDGQFESEVKSI